MPTPRTALSPEAKLDRAERAVQDILNWCDAYPLDVFPEPDVAREQGEEAAASHVRRLKREARAA